MTPSEKAKSLGCKSLKQVSETTETPIRTLIDWHKGRPIIFEAACYLTVERDNKDNQK